jgi:mannose-6-phosphate isomerase
MLNYPIKFNPILKEKIWGGNKILSQLNKKSALKNIGESWEISAVENNISVVSNGVLKGLSLIELVDKYKDKLLGKNNFEIFGIDFPLLIKFIDAKQDLSVQVHPNDILAKKRHESFGKNEFWYVLDTDVDSHLFLGFNKKIELKEFLNKRNNKKVESILNKVSVKRGNAFFIEAGTVHSIGAGILLAEIQQTSDITYRIYDFDRVDENGKKRELHTNLALEAIDFSLGKASQVNYVENENCVNKISHNKYFKVNSLVVNKQTVFDYSQIDSFIILICVEGNAVIKIDLNEEKISFGETVLIPASVSTLEIISEKCKILEISI